MDWKILEIDDFKIFKEYMQHYKYRTYDTSFTNLFMWSFSRKTQYKIMDGFLCIRGELNSVDFLYFPIGNKVFTEVITDLIHEFGTEFKMRAVNKEMADFLKTKFPGKFIYKNEDGRGDYIYKTSDLIELKGRKFHSKKNLINRFEKLYDYTYEEISPENIEEVINFQKWWCQLKRCKLRKSLKDEKIGVLKVLENYEKLDLHGGLIRVNNKVVAFSIGEYINEDTAVVHIEKADHNYLGAYQMMNKLFVEKEFSKCEYINREEDLGIPQLEKAKKTYNPVEILEKNRVFLK